MEQIPSEVVRFVREYLHYVFHTGPVFHPIPEEDKK